MSWLGNLFRSRRARKVAKQLAPIALRLLTDDKSVRQLALENLDEAFDRAVTLAGKAAGLELDAEQIRLTIARLEIERAHQRMLADNRRHEAELERIREKYGRDAR